MQLESNLKRAKNMYEALVHARSPDYVGGLCFMWSLDKWTQSDIYTSYSFNRILSQFMIICVKRVSLFIVYVFFQS